jgi:hypothetical protein
LCGFHLGMAVEDMDGDVWPEFAEGVGRRVAQDGVSIFGANGSRSPGLARIVGQGDPLRNSAAQELVEHGVRVVVEAFHFAADQQP